MKQCEDFKINPFDSAEAIKYSQNDIGTIEELESSVKMWLIDHYSKKVPSFATLLNEYDQHKSESPSFPSMENWTPPDRLISDQEKLLLPGPTLEVRNIRKIKLCLPITRRWVTYTSAKYEQSSRISSSYIALKNSSSTTPQFGRIENLFLHSFASKTTVLCKIALFAPPNYDEETKMWYVSLAPQCKDLYLTPEDITLPLVTGHDSTHAQIWFLNYM